MVVLNIIFSIEKQLQRNPCQWFAPISLSCQCHFQAYGNQCNALQLQTKVNQIASLDNVRFPDSRESVGMSSLNLSGLPDITIMSDL